MKCGRCGAEVMLGSAQCAKCGASVLDATTPDDQRPGRSMLGDGWTPPDTPPEAAVAAGMSVAAPTAPPPPPDLGTPPPPPPPPPTLTPAPPQLRPPVVVERSRRARQPGQATKSSVGCGCLGPLVAVAVIGGVVAWGSQSWFDDIGDAFDTGERQSAPAVSFGEEIEFEIGSDDTAVHPLRATVSGPAVVSVEAVGDFDPTVRVVEVDGPELGSDDDSGDDHDSLLTIALTEGHDYEIEVEGYGGDAGEYVLLVTSSVVDGAPVGRASQVAGSIRAGETARHPFSGPGGEVTVRVLGQESFDPVLTIRDSSGAELGTNDDADGRDSRLTLDVPLEASITIEVTGFNGAGGAYTVVVD
jgi:hypothetical protein